MSTSLRTRLLGLLHRPELVSLLGNGGSAVLGILTVGLLARWLTPAAFGSWMLYQTAYVLFETVRSGLVLNALIRFINQSREPARHERLAGAAWQLCIGFTAVVIVAWVLVALLPGAARYLGGVETARWFVLTSFVTLPSVVAHWLLHSHARFFPLQLIRVASQVALLLGIGVAYALDRLDYPMMCFLFFLSGGLVGVLTLLNGWSGARHLRRGTGQERRELLDFGKYTIGTLLASNLLRSADLFLLGLFLGPGAVAVYSIPQRLMQILETPLRSIVMTSIPKLAALHGRVSSAEWADAFHRLSGRLWVGLLPVALVGIGGAPLWVVLLGGSQYREAAFILQLFLIQGLLLPLDRYAGVGLDTVGRPQANLAKVLLMLAVTVGVDLLVLWSGGTVTMVAGVALLTFTVGMLVGYRQLSRVVPVSVWASVRAGGQEAAGLLRRLKVQGLKV
jgi:O-antigen/teichoic acid export membrane protein